MIEENKNGYARIYRYVHDGYKYYGQGLNEAYVRIAMETKLGLEPNTLTPGNDRLSIKEVRKVTMNTPDYKNFAYKAGIPRSVMVEKVTLGELLRFSGLDKQQIAKLIYMELNIPREVIDAASVNTTIKQLKFSTNDKVIIKTHKLIRSTVSEKSLDFDGNIEYTKRSVINNVLSRVDEIRYQIEMLLKLDYWLIVQYNDYENKLQKSKASVKKAEFLLTRMRKELTTEEIVKYTNNLITLPNEIRELEGKIRTENNRYHNTGFYVNVNDVYEENSYEEVILKFDSLYEKIRAKMIRYNLERIPFNDNINFEEAIDSYCLTSRQNNHYAKTK